MIRERSRECEGERRVEGKMERRGSGREGKGRERERRGRDRERE